MKIDTLGVQAFVAIAETGAFNRAAASLSITQSALSRRLRGLETYLGVRLIERTTRTVALSRSGESFLPQARRLLGELAATLNEIRETGNATRGDVTLACVPTMGVHYLPEVLREYATHFPNNRIRLLDHSSSAVEACSTAISAGCRVSLPTLRTCHQRTSWAICAPGAASTHRSPPRMPATSRATAAPRPAAPARGARRR